MKDAEYYKRRFPQYETIEVWPAKERIGVDLHALLDKVADDAADKLSGAIQQDMLKSGLKTDGR